jgi:hypothetical protein
LGELIAVGETHFTVRTAAGDVAIERATVTAAKRVGRRRSRSATERLELIAAAGVARGGRRPRWRLAAARVRRLDRPRQLGAGRRRSRPADGRRGRRRWSSGTAGAGLRPAIAVPLPLGKRIQPELDRRGWETVTPTLVQTVELVSTGLGSVPGIPRCRVAPGTDPRVVRRRRWPQGRPAAGGPPDPHRRAGDEVRRRIRRRRAGRHRPRRADRRVARHSVVGVEPAHRRRGWAARSPRRWPRGRRTPGRGGPTCRSRRRTRRRRGSTRGSASAPPPVRPAARA